MRTRSIVALAVGGAARRYLRQRAVWQVTLGQTTHALLLRNEQMRASKLVRKCALVFGAICIAVKIAFTGIELAHAQPSPAADGTYFGCFLDGLSDVDAVRTRSAANGVFIAKVIVIDGPYSLGGRHPRDNPDRPKDSLGAKLRVVTGVRGNVAAGSEFTVSFFERGVGRRECKYPATPDQKKLEYFVAGYVDDDGQRRLWEIPISKSVHDQWQREVLSYQRERTRAGSRQ